MKLDWDGVI